MEKFELKKFIIRMLQDRGQLTDSQIYTLVWNFRNMKIWSAPEIVKYCNTMQRVIKMMRQSGEIFEVSRKMLSDKKSEEILYGLPLLKTQNKPRKITYFEKLKSEVKEFFNLFSKD